MDRHKLFLEVHEGMFSGHFSEGKHTWSAASPLLVAWHAQGYRLLVLTCASVNVGSTVKPPLTPVSVGGPFNHVGVNVMKLPRTRWAPFFLLYGKDLAVANRGSSVPSS